MKWSWKLGKFRGISVYMHATFLILIAFIVFSHWSAGHSLAMTLEGVGFILAIFACVVLHEFGLLTAENVNEFLLIVSALGERRTHHAAGTP